MASNDNITARSSTFRWFHTKTPHSTSKKPENLTKSNIKLPGFRYNILSSNIITNSSILRNDIKCPMSSEPESAPENLVNYLASNSGEITTSPELLEVASYSSFSCNPGPKYKLIHEDDIQVYRINRSRKVFSKIFSSKFLRKWEIHHVYLTDTQITSKTPSGFLENAIPYSAIETISIFPQKCDAAQRHCVCIAMRDGSFFLQAHSAYIRDQWLHSISWKRNLLKFRQLLTNTRRPEVFIKEMKGLVSMALTTPLLDDCIFNSPLQLISEMLSENFTWFPKSLHKELISVISPLLELTNPTPEICDFLTEYCRDNPRSRTVLEVLMPIVQRILKHNMDFGKYTKTRIFVQEFIQALSYQNDEQKVLENFVNSVHGLSSTCPHPRVLPNLVSVCLGAIYSLYEEKRSQIDEEQNDNEWKRKLLCFLSIMNIISSYEDWRPGFSQLLQPIPFPNEALSDNVFTGKMKLVLSNIVADERCDVHLMVLSIREGKDGWLHLYCPGSVACDDNGDLWSKMLHYLLECCCRRKNFLKSLGKSLGPCMLRALREDSTLQEVLCSMLELEVVENSDLQMQMVTTLQSTDSGKQLYSELCKRQMHLRELQKKGGPRKLTLPSRSTDADVAKLLSCGSFGNLEWLSLAFTQVTSACAEQLIKLPSLRYLNLWSTQFGDAGLRMISDHLPKLQVLNLCETPVSDKGLLCLTNMKSLKKLNLNSTHLSAQAFERLKQKLPALKECDIRYTDAW